MNRWVAALALLTMAGCSSNGIATDTTSTSYTCGVAVAGGASVLPTEVFASTEGELVLLLTFDSVDAMTKFANGIKDLSLKDTAFRDAAAGVNFAGEAGGTRMVAVLDRASSADQVCELYDVLRQQAHDLTTVQVIDGRQARD